jgi:hypothetical protein
MHECAYIWQVCYVCNSPREENYGLLEYVQQTLSFGPLICASLLSFDDPLVHTSSIMVVLKLFALVFFSATMLGTVEIGLFNFH